MNPNAATPYTDVITCGDFSHDAVPSGAILALPQDDRLIVCTVCSDGGSDFTTHKGIFAAIAGVTLLVVFMSGFPLQAQGPRQETTKLKDGDWVWSLLAKSEEVTMCHHAIMAAHYEAKYLALGQNPVYRYVLDSESMTDGTAVYPDPERCKNGMTYFLVQFNDQTTGADLNNAFSERTGLSPQELVLDTRFLDMVLTKRMLDKGIHGVNPDSNISGDPWVYHPQ